MQKTSLRNSAGKRVLLMAPAIGVAAVYFLWRHGLCDISHLLAGVIPPRSESNASDCALMETAGLTAELGRLPSLFSMSPWQDPQGAMPLMGDPLSTTAGTGPDPPAKVAAKIEELLRDQMDRRRL